ncbi:cell division control protein 14 [Elasticomyces elasticus]|uniref:protein-tyrosine-phosphatase n=1 Tax=Exophiala sideris TaxID=1016849 RepID=A0ABR0JPR2_9EURO|nr:cell division control protein 14 [Elasticomyces elasticus]KAK5039571.1 cell division control protein 14 [Exophiala sideris]KAK5041123.1 cell division control protein 14 [Exophiala sideris]KAK5067948.1 cell division control protein 14 [Exophiala sideris]KAK5187250.1 cell division control protein 14 [Eurotiomycetes sp. CCFEE 6388]
MAPTMVHPVSYGQVIEYIQDRLYLASYTQAPNENTPFPYPTQAKRSPHKKSSRAQPGPTPATLRAPPVYFTIDDTLLYNAFHADFGPLHIGHLYRFAVQFHDILGDPANNDKAVVFWSRADARSRANAACLVACYMVLIQAWPPHLALAPIAQADPPYMPFRDAGYSQADFILNIQDVVYGVWKAKEENLCQLKEFNLEEYERYERVDMGDFNWVSPQFLAFASPQSEPVAPIPITSPAYATLPSCVPEIPNARISQPFKNVLTHFVQRDVGLVVRLNSELYCPSYFTALGIQHIDMIFEDGTCPTLPIVRKFIKLAHDTISKNKGVAVHCKAGLGRTGCLIGAYLIYRHGFTANEVIAFMRFMRPGMVVGPQQHWLHLNQGKFREWFLEDQWKAKLELAKPITPRAMATKTPMRISSGGAQIATPDRSSARRAALGEIDGNDVATYQDENLPAPTPGQPRKYARMDPRNHPYSRSTSGTVRASPVKADSEVTVETHRHSTNGAESEEELILQRAASRRSQSKSPGSKGKARSVSYTTTTTTMTKTFDVGDTKGIYEDDGDVAFQLEDTNAIWDELAQEQENLKLSTLSEKGGAPRQKTPRSASGMGAMSVSKTRSLRESPRRSGGEDRTKVRKTSGRVGSANHGPVAVKR